MKKMNTIFVIALCLTLLAFGFQFYKVSAKLLKEWGQGQNIIVYLDSPAAPADKIKSKIAIMNLVESVSIITPEKSWAEFQEQMATLGKGIDISTDIVDLIPPTLSVKLHSQITMDATRGLADQIKKIENVETVDFGENWISSYADVLRGFKLLGLSIGSFIFLIASFIIFKSVQVHILEQREKIEILELLGADAFFIRKPFLSDGFWIGLCASTLSLLFCVSLFIFLQKLLLMNTTLSSLSFKLELWSWSQVFFILILGPTLGFISSFLSVRSLNTGWAAAKGVQ